MSEPLVSGWQPIETAPKDGTWIIGYGESYPDRPIYMTMRWWNGILPENDDDLTSDEVGQWMSGDDRDTNWVQFWLPFQPHPDAPPVTDSINHFDGLEGIVHRSRAERGVTDRDIARVRHYVEHMDEVAFDLIATLGRDPTEEEFEAEVNRRFEASA